MTGPEPQGWPSFAQSVTPLVTVLVCLMEEREYAANVDVQLDAMLKGLHKGSKELRHLYVRCIALLVTSYLTRYGKVCCLAYRAAQHVRRRGQAQTAVQSASARQLPVQLRVASD